MFTSLSFAALMGFTHSFEADHLLAVSNIVTKRDRFQLAIKDGIYWGLGHTSTIFLVGLIIVFGKMIITEESIIFSYFEALVGFMLIILGFYRIFKLYKYKQHLNTHHLHDHSETHHLAYGVGLVHGLAGSGAVILSALATMKNDVNMLLFLLLFGLGSVVGMLLASGIFSLPFSKQWTMNKTFQLILTLVSCILCIGFGAKVIFENIIS